MHTYPIVFALKTTLASRVHVLGDELASSLLPILPLPSPAPAPSATALPEVVAASPASPLPPPLAHVLPLYGGIPGGHPARASQAEAAMGPRPTGRVPAFLG